MNDAPVPDVTTPPGPLLELRGVTRIFRQGSESLEVLRHVSLAIEAGEMVALVGPSGAGKSTLLQIAGLLERPTGGEVWLEGDNCTKISDVARARLRRRLIGFAYQQHHLLPE
ncbi:MAG: ATP-binding cassette domain-containing protein, partial [Bauldia litoralis]